ncbi:MAG TPA: PBP1A family penicillin-binding protein, partial [Gemmatimonadota bacterium]|nr:PBP1A family penicillin-binding protein [Gemmatimonadota bacterium]
PPPPRFWRGGNLLALIGIFLVCLGVGVFLGVYERFRADLPSIAQLEQWQPNLVTKVYAADGELIAEFASERREIIPLERVPQEFIRATLATEDRAFFKHDGIHLRRLFSAAWHNLTSGSKAQGGSTITMQLSRNLFLTPEKRFVRKFKEMILAHEIEVMYPKDRILEMYVNQVYFGSGAYGIESAARMYFGKPATELTLPEAALLAGIVQAPSRQSPRVSMEAARARRSVVLQNLVDVGAIDRDVARRAATTEIEVVPRRLVEGADTYFTEHVRRQIEQQLGTDAVWLGGYRIYTTLDPELQRAAEEAVERHLESIEKTLAGDKVRRSAWQAARAAAIAAGDSSALHEPDEDDGPVTPYLQGVLVSVDLQTGGIVAMVGGRSFQESKFNRATQSLRQPGSVFKPFVYTAAVRNGFPISYVVDDKPLSMPAGDGQIWAPVNYDRRFRGPVTLRHALTNSINVPTVRLMFDVGIQAVIDYTRDAGITSELPPYGSLALGAADLNPMEVLRAYTVYPTYGTRITPIAITRVEDRNGNVVRSFTPARTRVLSEQEAYVITSVLEDVVDKGTARYGVRGQGFEWPAAGKTGTTNESTDAWFVGFTPEYITLTWVGFDRKQRIRYNGTGGVLAAPIWTDFMKVAHEELELPEEGFPEPPGLEHVEVTTRTGMLAAGFCGMASYTEIMLPGTEPEHYCNAPREGTGVPLLEGPIDGRPRQRGGRAGDDEAPRVDDDFLF